MKIRHFIIAIAVLAFSANSFAQEFRLGGKIDVAGNWITGSLVDRGTRVIPHTSVCGGITGEYEFGDNIVLAAEILYSGKGYSDITDYINLSDVSKSTLLYRVESGYLQVPLLLGYKVDDSNKCTVFLGPEFGYTLFAKKYEVLNGKRSQNVNVKDWFNPFNLALALQIRYMFIENLGVEVKFDWGLTRTLKDESYKQLFVRNNTHNMGVQLGLVFNFEL